MAFESGVGPEEDWRSAVIVLLYEGKGERIKCRDYRGISFLSLVGKIYAGILVNKVCRVTRGLIGDEQEGFRTERGCVDYILNLYKRKNVVHVGFMDLEVYDKVNKEALWLVLIMHDVGGKMFNGIKSVYIDSLVYVRVK